ncbi:hypothetical protein ABZ070_34585 [Streptomyces sp. NPDC006283]|uniref:hypothetical protein n=1 Tax=Streptomyces sp. NPDC006283 TaxID=3156741 RepID=UPI0033B2D31C
MAPEVAGQILEDALAFVATAASSPGQALVPSRVVDEGWHALILHTGIYSNLCSQFGNFVHHKAARPRPVGPGHHRPHHHGHRVGGLPGASHLVAGPRGQYGARRCDCQHGDQSGPIVTQPRPKPKG